MATVACAATTPMVAFNRPVRLIVAFPPGGGSDTLARHLAPHLSQLIGQPVVVDNRTGAAGNIATEIVAKAQPDGHTLLWGFSAPLVINPNLYRGLPFDVERDLAPISLLATEQFILVTNVSVPASSVKDLIALARAKPGQLSYASARRTISRRSCSRAGRAGSISFTCPTKAAVLRRSRSSLEKRR
jgi:tripartite-type tricarboxylate transporter receptor subunit TctC